jgi:hypothetical protein
MGNAKGVEKFCLGISVEEDSPRVSGRTVLKRGLEKYRVQLTCGLNQTHDSFMASFREHGDENLSYVKGENKINSLVEFKCQVLNNICLN